MTHGIHTLLRTIRADKRRALSHLASTIIVFLLNSDPAVAWQGMPVPKLHIAGNQLLDPNGRVVILHGTHQPTDPYFAGDGRYFNSPTDYTNALRYFDAIVDMLSDTSPRYGFDHGWYLNYVRFAPDPYWFGDPTTGDFDMAKLQSFTNNVLVPYIQHCKSRGVYVVIFPNVVKPDNTTIASLQSHLETVWGYWSSVPAIKSADNVEFELMNEPVHALATDGTWGNGQPKYWQALTNWLQPIVDTIRNNGADNIIWVPGLSYQSEYQGFVQFPVNGRTAGNIGYAAHFYPQYGGMGDSPTNVTNYWNANYQPCADFAPMLITEMSWFRYKTGDNDYWHLFDGVTGDSSFGFGTAMRHVADAHNISWTIATQGSLLGSGPNTDMADPDGSLNYDPTRDSCGLAGFNWFWQYRATGPSASATVDAFSRIEAQRYDILSGSLKLEAADEGTQDLGYIASGDYAVFKKIDFGAGAGRFIARIAGYGGGIQLHLDSPAGTQLGDFNIPSTNGWQNWQTVEFTISNATGIHDLYVVFQPSLNLHWFSFDPADPNLPIALSNSGFETPSLGVGNFAYSPSGADWTFSGSGTNKGAGIAANASGFTSSNPNSPEGVQSAFIQSTGSMSATIAGPAYPATWTIRFLAAERKLRNGFGQSIDVLLDRQPVGVASPITPGYDQFNFTVSTSAGNHLLTLQGTSSADDTAFVDNLQVEVTKPPVPPAPTGLTATPQTQQVALASTGSVQSAGYNVCEKPTLKGGHCTCPARPQTIHESSATGKHIDLTTTCVRPLAMRIDLPDYALD